MNSDRIGFHIRTGGMHGGAALTLAMSRWIWISVYFCDLDCSPRNQLSFVGLNSGSKLEFGGFLNKCRIPGDKAGRLQMIRTASVRRLLGRPSLQTRCRSNAAAWHFARGLHYLSIHLQGAYPPIGAGFFGSNGRFVLDCSKIRESRNPAPLVVTRTQTHYRIAGIQSNWMDWISRDFGTSKIVLIKHTAVLHPGSSSSFTICLTKMGLEKRFGDVVHKCLHNIAWHTEDRAWSGLISP